MVPLEANPQHS